MRTLVLAIILVRIAGADCISVCCSRITARDLAGAIPQFQTLDPSTPVAFSPFPGTRRLISARELRAVAQHNGLAAAESYPSVCVERAVAAIDPDALTQSLKEALGIENAAAELELISYSNQPVPAGRFEFQRSGLCRPPNASPESGAIWRGTLVYDGSHTLPVWAKVRITVSRRIFSASEDIAAGATIREGQVQSGIVRQFLPLDPAVESLAEIVGKMARRRIRAGQRFVPGLLDAPLDVLRGARVHVRVVGVLALLSFDAIAEASGKAGDAILVHNPASGRNFHALVESRGRVIVHAGGD